MIVATLDETFQRKALCRILKLMSLAQTCVELTWMCLEYFPEVHTTRGGTGSRGGDWCSRQAPVYVPPLLLYGVLCPAHCARHQRGTLSAGKVRGGLGCQEALCPSAGPAVQLFHLRWHRARQLVSSCCPLGGLSESSPNGAADPNVALGQAHLSITSSLLAPFLVLLLVAKMTHPKLQLALPR